MRTRWPLVVVVVASLAGFFFASFSTADFAEHLDRQVHSIHCSFIPGLSDQDATGNTGCHVTMMSPYSSVLRKTFWGGIPVSLPAMSVFAFLVFFAGTILAIRREGDRRLTGFLALACALPFVVSIGMAAISLLTLGAACKLCIGIYLSSLVAFAASLVQWRMAVRSHAIAMGPARRDPNAPPDPQRSQNPTVVQDEVSYGKLGMAFGIGVLFVLVPFVAWIAVLPDYDEVISSCGDLQQPELPLDVRVPLDDAAEGRAGAERRPAAIEVLDPLCPSCRAFEQRLAASGLDEKLARSAVLFPLDNTCNWMVDEAVHPGACVISEAILCAEDESREVLEWAFAEQDRIKAAAATDPNAPGRMVRTRFPTIARCIGSPAVRARINRGLRWAVQNRLPVLTPQLYVQGEKLCDEDTDLGMDYALSRMLERRSEGEGG